MSGRKYSAVELANNVREAIRCRQAAQEALARAESLAAQLAETAQKVEALRPSASAVRETLREIDGELKSMQELFAESRLMQTDLSEVRRRRRKVDTLKADLEAIAERCREGRSAADVRAELSGLLQELERDRDTLGPWLADVYEGYTNASRKLLEEADGELRLSGGIGPLAQKIAAHTGRLAGMREDAAERRALDAERRYVAEALRKVCVRDMGFEAAIAPQANPLEDLVVEVNTFAFGVIHFRIALDGTIRSRSQLEVVSCPANFMKIQEGLRSLGVISDFRYEGDQSPVVIGKESKPMPEGEADLATRRGAL